jgi:hypothetical protein
MLLVGELRKTVGLWMMSPRFDQTNTEGLDKGERSEAQSLWMNKTLFQTRSNRLVLISSTQPNTAILAINRRSNTVKNVFYLLLFLHSHDRSDK